MVTRKEIAKQAAKLAAVAAYDAVMNTKMNKVASSSGNKLTVKDIAMAASKAAYNGVVKSAQQLTRVPVDFWKIEARLQQTSPQFMLYLQKKVNDFNDLKNFVNYIIQQGVGKESWAKPSRWEGLKAAILTNTDNDTKPMVESALKSFDRKVQAAADGQSA